jgi:hypothetical protein
LDDLDRFLAGWELSRLADAQNFRDRRVADHCLAVLYESTYLRPFAAGIECGDMVNFR